jgi:hypothetical protein
VTSIEWGIRQRHLPTGNVQEYYLGDQEEAADEYAHMADLNPERWEITFGYRTQAAEAGPFTEYRAPQGGHLPGGDGELAPEVIADIVCLASGVMIPPQVIATWTPAERELAVQWASAEHLHASDHHAVKRIPEPGFVTRAAEICASPAMAQLAVESWVQYLEMLHQSEPGFRSAEHLNGAGEAAEAGREAITGLLVLLRERQPS